jgi:hypothetical protein
MDKLLILKFSINVLEANSVQVEENVIAEAKRKIKERISLIFSMLEKWLLD